MGSALVPAPTIRLTPAPACEPPFDDERDPDSWVDGPSQPPLELVAQPDPDPVPRPAPPPVPTGPSPEARGVAARFVGTCLEILNGYRPVGHVRRLAAPREAAAVLEGMTRAVHQLRQGSHRPGGLVRLRTMRTCEPRPGVLEITVVVGPGARDHRAPSAPDRAWALAYRLERRGGSWRCTAAQIV
jgi:hypothetical protein